MEGNTQNQNTLNQNSNPVLENQNQGPKNGLAIAGLVCSLCGIITCGLTSIVGFILSIIGLSKSKNMNGEGKGLAIGGIVSGALIILLYVFVFVFMAGSIYSITNNIINGTDSRNDDSYYSDYYNDDSEKEEYALGDTFEFDNLKITLGQDYSFDVVDNEYSDYHNQTVVRLPITIKNEGTQTDGLNMFYYDVYGSEGTEVETLNLYFEDNVDSAGELRPGAEYTKYLYFQYDGNGSYSIEFDDYYTEIEVTFDIQR